MDEKIAILLACYNGEKYIEEMLKSLQKQTFQNFVCYIHDDGSNDRTVEIINSFCQNDAEHFSLLDGEKIGSAKGNFLWMLGQISADYYMFADQDDIWLPNKIEASFEYLRKNKAWCLFTDLTVVDEQLNVISPSMINYIGRDGNRIEINEIAVDNVAAGCTMLFTKELRNKCIRFADINHLDMHDQWVANVATLFGKLCFLNKSTILYRQHADNEMGAVHENACHKILRLFHDLSSGEIAKRKKEFLSISRDLAIELKGIEGINGEQQRFLDEWSKIDEKGKLKRLSFYRKHNISRKSKAATIWMWLWV